MTADREDFPSITTSADKKSTIPGQGNCADVLATVIETGMDKLPRRRTCQVCLVGNTLKRGTR
jgi:hypothetical protein